MHMPKFCWVALQKRLRVYGYLMKPPLPILQPNLLVGLHWRRKSGKVGHVCTFNEAKRQCVTSLCFLLEHSSSLFKRQDSRFDAHSQPHVIEVVVFFNCRKYCFLCVCRCGQKKWVPSSACRSNHVWSFLECNPIEEGYSALNLNPPLFIPDVY